MVEDEAAKAGPDAPDGGTPRPVRVRRSKKSARRDDESVNFRHLLDQARRLQKELAALEQRLEQHQAEGRAENGAVVVRVTGAGDVVSLTLAPAFVERADAACLERAVLAALRQATQTSRRFRELERRKLTGGLDLPDV